MGTSVVARIVSGGQTGVDRAALDAAIETGVEYGGWVPRGGWAEDFPDAPGLLARYPALRATDSADPAVRTRLNVRDSDATLIVVDDDRRSPGTNHTIAAAGELGRPCLVTVGNAVDVVGWLRTLEPGLTLNVAGPRESEAARMYDVTRRLLAEVLRPGA